MTKVVFVTLALVAGACGSLLAQPVWNQITQVYRQTCHQSPSRWTVCGVFQITQMTAAEGGPQALEGYTYVGHPSGMVPLAMGVIGNVELGGAGDVMSARALQGSVIVSGPGHITRAASLTLSCGKATGGYKGPINIDRCEYIALDNGVSIRPDGDWVVICDAHDRCRPL